MKSQHRHWHRHCKNLIFAFRNFFEKIEHLCYFLCFVMTPGPFFYKQLFLYNFLLIHPNTSIAVTGKGYLNFRKNHSLVFRKNNCSKNFCIFLSKTSKVESFLSTLAGLPGTFPKGCLEQLFCRKPVSACFCEKELHSTHYLRNFPQFWKYAM